MSSDPGDFAYTRGPKKNHVQRIAVTTTGAATALGENLLGYGKLRVKAVAAEVQFYFGIGTDVVTQDTVGSGNEVGWSLLAGQEGDFLLTSETHIVWDASGAGFLVLMRAGKERIGK